MNHSNAEKRYWLLKTEGEVYPIDQLRKDKKTPWAGVRNYRARNYMRDEMSEGDSCLFYHSSSKENGIYGIAKVASLPYPDPTQFDKKSDYFDPKSTEEKPIWTLVDIAYVKKFKKHLSVAALKSDRVLKGMMLWRQPRLSIQSVSEEHFRHIVKNS